MTTKSRKYSGIAPSVRIILKEEGVRGLYGGLGAALLGSFTSTLVYFGTYEGIKREAFKHGINPTLTFLFAAGVADIFAAVLYVPSEVIKTRMQLQGRFNNPYSVSGHNYRNSLLAFKDVRLT
jgi:Mitochondrial carrier protein